MSAWQTLHLRSAARIDLLDISDRVAGMLARDAEGLCVVFTPHATAALLLNEAEEGLLGDLRAWLERLAPRDGAYAHDRIDDNTAAHLRAVALGASVVVPVEAGRLQLGRWQRIFFVELDGPRAREVRVRLVS